VENQKGYLIKSGFETPKERFSPKIQVKTLNLSEEVIDDQINDIF
jgi:hypothetical protein